METTYDWRHPADSVPYRAFVGPAEYYDRVAAWVFTLLVSLGMVETHKLLDIGCGSLRSGRLLIPYLLPNNYYGIEPEEWLIQQAIQNEVGQSQIDLKKPSFLIDANFNLSSFNKQFDYLIAQSIFSHAAKHQIRQSMTEAAKVMHSNSIFAANFLAGDHSYEGEEWVYPAAIWYKPEDIIALAEEQGLRGKVINWPHREQTWVLIIKPENEYGFDQLERRLVLPPFSNNSNNRFVPLVDTYKAEVDELTKELAESRRQFQTLETETKKLQGWALEMQAQLGSQPGNPLRPLKKFLKRNF